MNSKTLAALAGLCVAAPAMAQITSARNDITMSFINIANTGASTRLNSSTATHDDSSYSFAGVTNAGISSSIYRASTNGFVMFGAGTNPGSSWINTGIPQTGNNIAGSSAAQMIAPFWDDMITGAVSNLNNGVWAQTGDASAFGGINLNGGSGPVAVTGNVTIIQWQGMDLFQLANPQNATFQLVVFAAPVVVNGVTVYAIANYSNTVFNTTSGGPGFVRNDGESASVGYNPGASALGTAVEWGAGNNDLGTTFTHRGNYVTSGSSLAFVPAPGAAALLGIGGLVAARRRRA
jgi:hypothetical protein